MSNRMTKLTSELTFNHHFASSSTLAVDSALPVSTINFGHLMGKKALIRALARAFEGKHYGIGLMCFCFRSLGRGCSKL